jgi:flavin reductase (DIM6/NTAB) family NADH-FMN oxidoreductase RutF
MASWGSGVAVVAAPFDMGIEAITVTSFISVSLEPALTLISLSRHAPILALLQQHGRYTISALADDQARIAALVADRVPQLKKIFTDGPDPAIEDALFVLTCSNYEFHQAGDHVLCIGKVEHVQMGREAGPLIYHRRKYRPL